MQVVLPWHKLLDMHSESIMMHGVAKRAKWRVIRVQMQKVSDLEEMSEIGNYRNVERHF